MDEVAVDACSGLESEEVDASHVGEDAVSEVVDMVPADAVFAGDGVVEAPVPADGDAGVGEVMDVVVFDEVAEGVGDEDADGAEVGESDVVDVVVEDGDAAGGEGGVVVDGGTADADAAGAEVMEVVVFDADVGAAGGDFESVPVGCGEGAVVDVAV